MKVFLTGAFGNVGMSVIARLSERGHDTYVFDQKTKKNKKIAKKIKNTFSKLIWGDIRDYSLLEKSVVDCDCIIHLAAIVPPESEISKNADSKHLYLFNSSHQYLYCYHALFWTGMYNKAGYCSINW